MANDRSRLKSSHLDTRMGDSEPDDQLHSLTITSNPYLKNILGGSPGLVVVGGDSLFQRLWVRIPAPYYGWTFFTFICICFKIVMFVWKYENKWKRGRGWPIFKDYLLQARQRRLVELSCYSVGFLPALTGSLSGLVQHECDWSVSRSDQEFVRFQLKHRVNTYNSIDRLKFKI